MGESLITIDNVVEALASLDGHHFLHATAVRRALQIHTQTRGACWRRRSLAQEIIRPPTAPPCEAL
jgi:hypothetical protein